MQVHRCPECGMRLNTNYCDICMRKVPFAATQSKQTWQHVEGSSAHREEKHVCITFDDAEQKPRKARRMPKQRQPVKDGKKKASIAAIVLAAISVISSLFGLVEDFVGEETHMEYNQEAYITEVDVPSITGAEIYNDGGIVITADSSGLYYDEYAIAMTIENGSDRDIVVFTDQLSVNGYMTEYGMSAEVDAGDSCQMFLTLYSFELEKMDITQIAQVEFCLNIYDADDYTDIATSELISLETDIAESFVQPVDESGWELYNDGSVRLLLRGMEMSEVGGCDLEVYIENLSGSTASVNSVQTWVNGQEVDGNLWCSLRPDTRAVDNGYITNLQNLGITGLEQINEITLELHIEYMEDWYVAETVNETVAFNPNDLPPAQ